MKKFIVVLVVLFIGILFAGCTSQQAPAATPTPTEVPTMVATPVPTPVPTAMPTPVATPNVTANVTANVTPVVTAPMPPAKIITFSEFLTVTPTGTIYLPVNTTVAWYNADPYKQHGIQSIGSLTSQYFGKVVIPYGKFFNVTFSKAGTYQYVTIYQPYSGGTFIVK
ncbi:hypothetical protein [Methanoregula sp.]|uniref:cupredoxin domain-containing protein n=1 Tax=Methanoregula sp. TaxID=2052170 RepID=UPI003BAFF50C